VLVLAIVKLPATPHTSTLHFLRIMYKTLTSEVIAINGVKNERKTTS
jgi:hypothetical protein